MVARAGPHAVEREVSALFSSRPLRVELYFLCHPARATRGWENNFGSVAVNGTSTFGKRKRTNGSKHSELVLKNKFRIRNTVC